MRDRAEATCHICLEGGRGLERSCPTCQTYAHPHCQDQWHATLNHSDERRYRCSVCRSFFRAGERAAAAVTSPRGAENRGDARIRRTLLCNLFVNLLLLAGFVALQAYWMHTPADTFPRLVTTQLWLVYNCVAVAVSGSLSVCAIHMIEQMVLPALLTLSVLFALAAAALVLVDIPTSLIAYFLSVILFLAIFVRYFHALH